MLVAAFQIHGAGPFQFRTFVHDTHMAGSGIEPHIHDIFFLAEMGVTALGTFRPFRQQLVRFIFPPGITALFFKDIGNFVNGRFIYQRFVAFFTVKRLIHQS